MYEDKAKQPDFLKRVQHMIKASTVKVTGAKKTIEDSFLLATLGKGLL